MDKFWRVLIAKFFVHCPNRHVGPTTVWPSDRPSSSWFLDIASRWSSSRRCVAQLGKMEGDEASVTKGFVYFEDCKVKIVRFCSSSFCEFLNGIFGLGGSSSSQFEGLGFRLACCRWVTEQKFLEEFRRQNNVSSSCRSLARSVPRKNNLF